MFLQQSNNDLLIGFSLVTDFLQLIPGGWCYLDCGYHESPLSADRHDGDLNTPHSPEDKSSSKAEQIGISNLPPMVCCLISTKWHSAQHFCPQSISTTISVISLI
jgi:hypothetical protein